MDWLNEPPRWNATGDAISLTTAAKTDFWRVTHYKFVHDNGHFHYQEVAGDFVADVKVTGAYAALYDQAGLMVRRDETAWLKCGIEFVDGVQQVSAVVTRDYSDWSVVPLFDNPPSIWLRLTRRGSAVEIAYSFDAAEYRLLRLAYFPPADSLHVGVMAASPDGPGFDIVFEGFRVRSL